MPTQIRLAELQAKAPILIPYFYQTLAHRHGDGFKGIIAKSWDVSKNERQLRINLAPNATFHDGSPIDANDVRNSILLACAENPAGALAFVDTVDANGSSIDIVLTQPHYLSLSDILLRVPIFAPGKRSGAFKVIKQTETQLVIAKPFFEHTFFVAPTAFERLKLVANGQLSRTIVSVEEAQKSQTNSKLKFTQTRQPETRILLIAWNREYLPFANKEIRQALTLLIKRRMINETLFDGFLQNAVSFFGNRSRYRGNKRSHQYNPEKAITLIAKNGYTIDRKKRRIRALDFTLSINTHKKSRLLAQRLKQDFAQNGIHVRIRESAHLKNDLHNNDFQAALVALALPPEFNPIDRYRFLKPLTLHADSAATVHATLNRLRASKLQAALPKLGVLHPNDTRFSVIKDWPRSAKLKYMHALNDPNRIQSRQHFDRYLGNQFFATLLFEPSIAFVAQKK